MEQKEITNYSDLKQEAFPGAEKIELISVLNKPMVIYDYRVLPSTIAEGKEFVVILAELEDGKKVSVNAGEVVRKQLDACKDKLPIGNVTITKPKGKRYYILAPAIKA